MGEGAGAMTRVVAVLTCFNRRESTLRCLGLLESAARAAGVEPAAVLVDDGSTDGTAQAVGERFPWVDVLRGGGNLFWNRGMHRGLEHVYARRDFDHVLWLNDDTHLLPDALVRLLDTASDLRQHLGREAIVVGATADPSTGRITYGGKSRGSRWRPFQFRTVADDVAAQPCDTMNGNVVLVPQQIALDVGNLDPTFEHSMGDIDYGLRARRKGHPLYVAAGIVGHCRSNSVEGTHRDTSLPLAARWRRLTSRKELPPRSWLRLTSRHGGLLWPLHFMWPYAKVLMSGAIGSATPKNGTKGSEKA